MRLPLEVRDRIYWMLLGGRLLHIDDGPREDGFHLGHCICQQLSKEELTQQFSFYFRYVLKYTHESERPNRHFRCCPRNKGPGTQWLDLRVLRTCRQIYCEAVSTLWTTNTFSFNVRSTFLEFLHGKTVEQRRKIRHVRFDISHPTTLDWWLRDAQNLLVAYTKENTLHLTVNVKKHHARHWLHPEASYLAKYILGADPDLYLYTAEFNIEVEDDHGGISVITGRSLVQHISEPTLTRNSRGDQETNSTEKIEQVGTWPRTNVTGFEISPDIGKAYVSPNSITRQT